MKWIFGENLDLLCYVQPQKKLMGWSIEISKNGQEQITLI